jgi:hypothetical protein
MTKPENKSANESASVTFDQVFAEELGWIRARRAQVNAQSRKLRLDVDQGKEIPDDLVDSKKFSADMEKQTFARQEQALEHDLCGLAISGGGIRSATFALGVLQGLASKKLLTRFDYLSTVSGGGYIGSWLSAWISRLNEEKQSSVAAEKEDNQDSSEIVAMELRFPAGDENGAEVDIVFLENDRHLATNRNGSKSCPPGGQGGSLFDIQRNIIPSFLTEGKTQDTCDPDRHSLVEDRVVTHLRSYSNYMAPTLGLFSPDGYGLIAIYLRNVLLNQLILIMLTFGAFSLVSFVNELFELVRPIEKPNPNLIRFFVAALFFFSIGMSVIGYAIQPKKPTESGLTMPRLLMMLIFSWGIGGLFMAFLMFNQVASRNFTGSQRWDWPVIAMVMVFFSVFHGLAGWISVTTDEEDDENSSQTKAKCQSLIAGLTGGLLGGLVFLASWSLLLQGLRLLVQQKWDMDIELISAIGVPMTLMTFIIANFLMVGFAKDSLTELRREQWSTFNAYGLAIASCWVVVFAVVLMGPPFVQLLLRQSSDYAWATSTATAATWLGFIVTGLKMANSAQVGGLNKHGWKETFVKIAAVMFMVTLLLLVAVSGKSIVDGFFSSELLDDPLFSWVRWHRALFYGITAVACFLLTALLGNVIGANRFTLHNLYANRLTRCYLGASADRVKSAKIDPLTHFCASDDLRISALANNNQGCGPLLIINGALNQGGKEHALNLQERKAESFVFTPLHCGSDSTGYVPSADFAGGVSVGNAIAVSGAAVSPNMGYHSDPGITALLTVFNIRLGAWFGNPSRQGKWRLPDVPGAELLLNELVGKTSSDKPYVYVSDGGHFENMGVYELIRRRCRFIVAIDAGGDPNLHENVGRLVRLVRIDFGIWIEIDLKLVTPDAKNRCAAHLVVGRIHYDDIHKGNEAKPQGSGDLGFEYDQNHGVIIWIKNGLTGDEPADVLNYEAMNPGFPYQSITDQFFNEPQFESYRALGVHTVVRGMTFLDKIELDQIETLPSKIIFEAAYKASINRSTDFIHPFLQGNVVYSRILRELRTEPALNRLADGLYSIRPKSPFDDELSALAPTIAELTAVGEMYSLLESLWLSLDLNQQSKQPMYTGWMQMFENWRQSQLVKDCWKLIKGKYNPGFREFIDNDKNFAS